MEEILNLKGVCAKKVLVVFDDSDRLQSMKFEGGCKGNLAFISKLLIGKSRREIIALCEGNICGSKNTSCMDQLAKQLNNP